MTHNERTRWTFTSGGPIPRVTVGELELDSRLVRCYADGTIAWENIYKTRALARASYEGDLRAMRKNDCYTWQ